MAAAIMAFRGWLGSFTGVKPVKPSARGNAAAFRAGAKSFKASNGATPDLQRVVMLSIRNDARRKK